MCVFVCEWAQMLVHTRMSLTNILYCLYSMPCSLFRFDITYLFFFFSLFLFSESALFWDQGAACWSMRRQYVCGFLWEGRVWGSRRKLIINSQLHRSDVSPVYDTDADDSEKVVVGWLLGRAVVVFRYCRVPLRHGDRLGDRPNLNQNKLPVSMWGTDSSSSCQKSDGDPQ